MNKVIAGSILLSLMAYSYSAAKADNNEDEQICTAQLDNLEVSYLCADNPYLYTTESNCSGVTQFANSYIGWDVTCTGGENHVGHLDLASGKGKSDGLMLTVQLAKNHQSE